MGTDVTITASDMVSNTGVLVALGDAGISGSGFANASGGVVEALGMVSVAAGSDGIAQGGDLFGQSWCQPCGHGG